MTIARRSFLALALSIVTCASSPKLLPLPAPLQLDLPPALAQLLGLWQYEIEELAAMSGAMKALGIVPNLSMQVEGLFDLPAGGALC